jgi:hypothetical protein
VEVSYKLLRGFFNEVVVPDQEKDLRKIAIDLIFEGRHLVVSVFLVELHFNAFFGCFDRSLYKKADLGVSIDKHLATML